MPALVVSSLVKKVAVDLTDLEVEGVPSLYQQDIFQRKLISL